MTPGPADAPSASTPSRQTEKSSFALFGTEPAVVAKPETVAELQELVVAAEQKVAFVPWGGGSRQHIGYPPERYDVALDTTNLGAIVEYAPADMVVTAQAGVTVDRLQSVLAEHRQFLPVDVAQPHRQTIGGLIASRPDSLRRFAFGSVRDALIGVSVVNARGELIKGGGKVVKNVSGYDLPKLYCGSFGTLGVIVEASFKVSPLPEASATAMLALTADHNSEDVLDMLLGSDISPSFVYLVNPTAAQRLMGVPEDSGSQFIVIGFDGPSEAVEWQVKALNALAGVAVPSEIEAPAASSKKLGVPSEKGAPARLGVRELLRDFPNAPASAAASFHILSSQIGAFARMVEWTARRAGFSAAVVADAAVGVMWAQFEPRDAMGNWDSFYKDLADKASRCGGSFIIERMPDEWREAGVPVWSPILPDIKLMQSIKKALDPNRIWNPGRFVAGL
jgi:glycolate oxidase FAD binding subunit